MYWTPDNLVYQHYPGHTGMAKKHTGVEHFVTVVELEKDASAACRKITLLSGKD
jgi:hypothetical protein